MINKDLTKVEVLTKKVFTSDKTLSRSLDFKELVKHCPTIKELLVDSPENLINLARNRHFEKDGEIFRVRTFIEDADNGSYTKLVLYKEDEDGFPRIQKLPKGSEVDPTEKYILSFIKGGNVIHVEEDYRAILSDGTELTYSSINGKIVKINSQRDECSVQKY